MELMCVANKYLSQLEIFIKELKEERDRLLALQSYYDKLLSDHYHKVEELNFGTVSGYHLADEQREILRQRRVVRNETTKICSLLYHLNINEVSKFAETARKSLKKTVRKQEKNNPTVEWADQYKVENIDIQSLPSFIFNNEGEVSI